MNVAALIDSILRQAVDESNRLLPAGKFLSTADDCAIAAPTSSLDSLGFIGFLAALESAASRNGHRLELLNEDSLTNREDLFADVAAVKQTLAQKL